MKRYIKVNKEWIDTLEEQRQYGRYYWIDKDMVYYMDEEDHEVGKLQEESDEQLRNDPKEFLNEVPGGSYNKYKEWCIGKPLSKKKFRGYKNTYETLAL